MKLLTLWRSENVYCNTGRYDNEKCWCRMTTVGLHNLAFAGWGANRSARCDVYVCWCVHACAFGFVC